MGHFADWIFCLVRTDFGTSIRQEGISFLLIDMKTPGISVRPLVLMDGGHEVNEVFFDNVEVPAGEPGSRGGQGLDGGQVPAWATSGSIPAGSALRSANWRRSSTSPPAGSATASR